jgi:hypothetical protein
MVAALMPSVESFVGDTSLFEDDIRELPRSNVRIDREFVPIDRAVPDFVIALAGPVEYTVMTLKNFFKPRGIAGHLRRVGQPDSFLSMEIQHNLDGLVALEVHVV